MSGLGQPVRINIPAIASSFTRRRPIAERPLQPPGRNWAKALEECHPELVTRRMKVIECDPRKKKISRKTEKWCELIGEVLRDPAILAENVYNTDETG